MAAQAPYMLLHPTTTAGTSNNTAATTSNPNVNYYQPRAGQTDSYGRRIAPAPMASYPSYPAQTGGPSGTSIAGGGAYYRIPTNEYPAGSSSLVASTSSPAQPGTSARGASRTVASTSHQKPTFRAPAHKHAHHLHSIPPREKSTRTLIVDHMLWAHARTRFAQARAELGMTDRTGGPSSSHYSHRTRPEEYEEEDEMGSEGEESNVLKARVVGTNDRSEEIRLSKQDLVLARTLRLRAEGLEKVVTSMLDQPPPLPHKPPADDHYNHHHHYHHHHHHSHSHWQKYETLPNTRTGTHPHTLPNGVRLRLALGTIVNDLFARQAPHLPYRHSHPTTSDDNNQDSTSSPLRSFEGLPSVVPSKENLPEALLPLVRISGIFNSQQESQLHHHRSTSVQSQSSNLVYTPQSSPYQSFAGSSPIAANQNPPIQQYQQQYNTGPSPFMVQGLQIYQQPQPTPPPPPQTASRPRGPAVRPTASQRALSLYTTGANIHTDGTSQPSRCPRHLQTRCEICVEATSPTTRSSGGSSGRPKAFVISSSGPTTMGSLTTIGGMGGPPAGISGWRDGSGMGTGLLKPGPRGSVLRRKTYLGTEDHHASSSTSSAPSVAAPSGDHADDRSIGAGNTKLARLIPRFIKLSALVAGELGREVRGEEVEDSSSSMSGSDEEGEALAADGSNPSGSIVESSNPARSSSRQASSKRGEASTSSAAGLPQAPASPTASVRTRRRRQQHQRMYDYALKPTKEWYLLLAGLLTRAVLEGYFTAGWRGVEAAECLLLLGIGVNSSDLDDTTPVADVEIKEEEGEDLGDGIDLDEETRRKQERLRKWKKRRKTLELFDEDEEFSEFHPDEYPSLFEALRVLFPSLRTPHPAGGTGSGSTRSRKGKSKAEAEYEAEMYERLRRFYDIPASTPDLATHMEDLVWQYPAEPIERAAVRFCEAVAKWRGKPELETKKPRPRQDPSSSHGGPSNSVDLQDFFGTDALSIESLVHSNPTSPTMGNAPTGSLAGALGPYGTAQTRKLKKPNIDMYFSVREGGGGDALGPGAAGWSGGRSTASVSPTFKRKRLEEDGDVGREGGPKRVHS